MKKRHIKTIAVTVFLLALNATPLFGQATRVTVPAGQAPNIDGTMQSGEWYDTAKIPLEGGDGVYITQSGGYLYVAVRGASGGFTSLGIATIDSLRILHSSTALITAAYLKEEIGWRLVHGFKAPVQASGEHFSRGEVRLTDAYRSAKLEQFGWTANVVDAGDPRETEFQIEIADSWRSGVFLSVVFFQVRAATRIAFAPETLADDTLNRELISGTAADGLQFDTTKWTEVRW